MAETSLPLLPFSSDQACGNTSPHGITWFQETRPSVLRRYHDNCVDTLNRLKVEATSRGRADLLDVVGSIR